MTALMTLTGVALDSRCLTDLTTEGLALSELH
jgi:hypothetical protein